jgi:hypothetical protein
VAVIPPNVPHLLITPPTFYLVKKYWLKWLNSPEIQTTNYVNVVVEKLTDRARRTEVVIVGEKEPLKLLILEKIFSDRVERPGRPEPGAA